MENGKTNSSAQLPDARAVANALLDIADRKHISVTHIALHKLLYFAHGEFLIRRREALLSGFFEAWKHGPVHPLIYAEFKRAGAAAISMRATRMDFVSGHRMPLDPLDDSRIGHQLERTLEHLGHMTPSQLRALSHAPRGPWHWVQSNLGTTDSVGARISDNVTVDRFRYMLLPIGAQLRDEDAREDSPLA